MEDLLRESGGDAEARPCSTYPSTKVDVEAYESDFARRERLTPAKARIIGSAEGTIMPTIITAHMANRAERSWTLQGFILTMHMAKGSCARYHK
jgi:hypothetical protein